jgi:hypothetical protein
VQGCIDFFQATEIVTDEETFDELPVLNIMTDVAWENKTFDTVNKPIWCSVFYIPNTPAVRTIGQKGFDEITGFLQIDFNIAENAGEGSLPTWENKARKFFYAGQKFSFDGQFVIVTSSGMSQGRHVDSFYRKSLTINFKSQLQRPKLTP